MISRYNTSEIQLMSIKDHPTGGSFRNGFKGPNGNSTEHELAVGHGSSIVMTGAELCL